MGCSSSLGHCHCLGNFGKSSCHNRQILVEVRARLGDDFEADMENLRSWKHTQSRHESDVTSAVGSLGAVIGLSLETADQLMIDEMVDPEDPRRGHSMAPYR